MIWIYAILGYVIWNCIGYKLLMICANYADDNLLVDIITIAICLTILPLFGIMYLVDVIKLMKDL